MAKPIFLINVQADIPPDRAKEIEAKVSNRLKDEYHVLIVGSEPPGCQAQFQVFNVETMPEATFEEIKKIVEGINVTA